ncbi:PREDICTED: cdc42 effector protein 4 [Ceratotherium simum simum]|uniref:Cdc42 effector protein 4 n=1 Tax=Ceratotherium simum simum TaxID=73337 RepID=A0ABM1CYQ9_CERSS|nr:PREDICTED: cdc42 effector protein 4 [Ceratotherium simum simum]XP_014644690.1 PREDICTED: cdc42 effector protein 4 [Ceratotherium simum simum]XP_014644691.1 PREDICTED: cdc42 effector protein 4 [Ceratotherium simum simum]XP_014644692.1 PREDICTED: cdc42 effector protein 4 [Ceratotherium simum simum]
MPILKQLVSSSVHSKRRSRVDLTAEMISAPLGDFRHTMHVGRAGDAFGDTSFLNSKAGELDGESLDEQASSSSSKRSLLSRKFRGSKRSQSVTRGDREQRDMLGSLRDSALFVKNAMSLPQLNEKEAAEKGSSKLPKSLSSSPVKKANAGEGSEEEAGVGEVVPRRNGATAPHSPDPLLDEQAFGDLTDLPVVPKASFGLKHAESIMSFHIDLGPSMLGDVLSIMDKEEWEPEEEDGGYHGDDDPAGSLTEAPPSVAEAPPLTRQEGKASPDLPPLPPQALHDEGWAAAAPSPGSARSVGSHTTRDSSSLSSCTSGVLEERSPAFRGPDRARATLPRQPDKEFSFMDEEEEDEIRV